VGAGLTLDEFAHDTSSSTSLGITVALDISLWRVERRRRRLLDAIGGAPSRS
jgi:hypothetical protein